MGPLQLNGNVAAHTWRSELLGEPRSLEVSGGTLDYFERGEGPTLLFSHGWLANANLWRKVVDALQSEFRCLPSTCRWAPIARRWSPVRISHPKGSRA